jgi:protein HIRA/HIR1
MCWSPDGYGLLCCSLDGTVASFVFDPQELGEVMSGRETQAALERLYGDAAQRKGHAIIEDPALLALQATAAAAAQQQQQQARRVVPTPTDAGLSQPPPAMPLASTPQREFRGTDGRRRIVPMAVGAPPPTSTGVSPMQMSRPPAVFGVSPALGGGGGGGGSASQPPGGPSAFASAAATASAMPPPQRRELTFPGGGEGSLPPFGGAGTASQPARRVVPQPVGPPPAAGHAPPPPSAPPARPVSTMTLSAQVPPAKRKATEAPGPGPSMALAVVPAAGSPQRAAVLPVPETQGALVAQLAAASTSQDGTSQLAVLLEARNTDAKCTLACSRGGEVLWRDVLPGAALALAGSPSFSAVSTSDGCLTIYTPAGRRALPPIALGGPAALMSATGSHLLVAASGSGALWLWHLLPTSGEVTCLVHDSVAPLLAAVPPGTSIASLRLSAGGHPLAVLSNGQAYFLSPALKAWARVADGHHLRSDYWSVLGGGGGEMAQLLAGAARGAVRSAGGPGPLLLTSSAPGGESARSETGRHLEAMVASAVALRSAQDLRRWLPAYAAQLATDNQLARLRELLTELLGPAHWAEPQGLATDARGPGGWAPRLLGESKRELLRGLVLPAVATSRAAQRLCAEFVDLAAGVAVQDAPAA